MREPTPDYLLREPTLVDANETTTKFSRDGKFRAGRDDEGKPKLCQKNNKGRLDIANAHHLFAYNHYDTEKSYRVKFE